MKERNRENSFTNTINTEKFRVVHVVYFDKFIISLTNPANGSAMGPNGLAATNLAALPAPAEFWFEGIFYSAVKYTCGGISDGDWVVIG